MPTARCAYCDTWVEGLPVHILAEHELSLRRVVWLDGRISQRICVMCATAHDNLLSHHLNQHVDVVTVVVGGERQSFARGALRMFSCSVCGERYRNPALFRVR